MEEKHRELQRLQGRERNRSAFLISCKLHAETEYRKKYVVVMHYRMGEIGNETIIVRF